MPSIKRPFKTAGDVTRRRYAKWERSTALSTGWIRYVGGPVLVAAVVDLLLSFALPQAPSTRILIGIVIVAASSALWLQVWSDQAALRTFEKREALASVIQDASIPMAAVECAIYEAGVVTGKDKGVLWVEEGMLAFKGARTCFALGGGDVNWFWYPPPITGHVFGQKSIQCGVVLADPGKVGGRGLAFKELEKESYTIVRVVLQSFRWAADPAYRAQLPPRTRGPSASSASLLIVTAICTSAVVFIAGFILLFFTVAEGLELATVPLVVGWLLALKAACVMSWNRFGLAYRALRHRLSL